MNSFIKSLSYSGAPVMVHGTYFGHLENCISSKNENQLDDQNYWKIKLNDGTVLFESEQNFQLFNKHFMSGFFLNPV